jgi:hypothetical protein
LTCERCGAAILPSSEQCAYCGTVSEQARVVLQAERARQQQLTDQQVAQQAVLRQQAFGVTEQAASRALLFGLLSLGFFCVPVFNVLAFLAFKRAQAGARAAGSPLPTRATVGLLCSLLTGVLCVASWAWMVTDIRADDARVEARKTALGKQIAAHPASPTLDQSFACALAEQYVLTNGFDGSTNTGSFRDVTCAGALKVSGERAEMVDFKLKTSSSGEQRTATICFKHGALWFVESAGVTSCALQ